MEVRPIDGNILRKWCEKIIDQACHPATVQIGGVFLDKVRSMPTLTPPNEWVSVEERLPGSQEDVLVVAFWHECWQTMIGWHSDAGKKWRVITPHGEREPGGVSHWMPIPAPPDRRPPEGEEDTQ